MLVIPERVTERAFSKWTEDENGCYISTYSTGSHGYAQIGWQDDDGMHGTTAHRAAYVHVHGQIDGVMDVDHRPTCDRRCVNVDHLRLITPSQNRRRNKRDFDLDLACKRGHPESERYMTTRQYLACRECERESQRAYDARQREKNPPKPHWRTLQTECKFGHPLVQGKNQRYCRICTNDRSRVAKARKRPLKVPSLTPEQVEAIKADTRSTRAIGKDHGVSHTLVRKVKDGTWNPARSSRNMARTRQ